MKVSVLIFIVLFIMFILFITYDNSFKEHLSLSKNNFKIEPSTTMGSSSGTLTPTNSSFYVGLHTMYYYNKSGGNYNLLIDGKYESIKCPSNTVITLDGVLSGIGKGANWDHGYKFFVLLSDRNGNKGYYSTWPYGSKSNSNYGISITFFNSNSEVKFETSSNSSDQKITWMGYFIMSVAPA